jgi:hypothetical protein
MIEKRPPTVYLSDDPQAHMPSYFSHPGGPPATDIPPPPQEELLLEGTEKETSHIWSVVKTFWHTLQAFCHCLLLHFKSKSRP